MRLIKWLDEHLEETLMIILLIIIACVTMIQVIVRKVPWLTSLTWAEEFCRFMWIWSVFISLPYTIRMENMLRVGVLVDLLPQAMKKIIGIIVDLINMFCMGLLGFYSFEVLENIYTSHEFSPAMEWPMWIVYAVMLFGYVLATIRAFQVMILHVKRFHERELTTLELIIIACVTMIQVIVRKVPWLTSLTWAEEFCRFMWIWSVFISLPYTIRMENMLRVGVLVDLLPQAMKKIIGIIVDLINMFCMGLLGFYSFEVLENIYTSHEFSPAMEWPMWIVYAVMLFGYVLATIRAFQVMILHVKRFHERELTTLEQTMQDAAKEAEMAKGGDE